MSVPFYRVNGVDMVPYLKEKGFNYDEEDVDADGSGRDLDGDMHRAVVARKDKHTLSFRELETYETRTVLNAFSTQYVQVQLNFHPKISGTVSLTMYNSSRKSAAFSLENDDDGKWEMQDISLIQK